MEYISQINGYWRFIRSNEMTPKQTLLYFALLDEANSAWWCMPFSVRNSILLGKCSISESEFYECRNVLIQKGLINYEKGKKGCPGTYDITPLYRSNPQSNPHRNPQSADQSLHTNIQRQSIQRQDEECKSDEKTKYAEFVSMTAAEYDRLVKKFGERDTQAMIEILDNYKGQSGKSYESDYRAVLNWVAARLSDEQKKEAQSHKKNSFFYEDSNKIDYDKITNRFFEDKGLS